MQHEKGGSIAVIKVSPKSTGKAWEHASGGSIAKVDLSKVMEKLTPRILKGV